MIRCNRYVAKVRVVNSRHETVGFILDKVFIDGSKITVFMNIENTVEKIEEIDNLTITSNDVIRARKKLREITLKELNNETYNSIVKDNILERDIQEELENWRRKDNDKVLQLGGSRQIGKTTELKKFAYKNYENVIYVNMANDSHKFEDIAGTVDYVGFMNDYCIKTNMSKFENNKSTILIIDDIQESIRVYNRIRDINEMLNCDVIVACSYLGYTLRKEYFKSEDKLAYIDMHSLSFREFCRTFQLEDKLMKLSLTGDSDKEEYNSLFKKYSVYKKIGGYPRVVMNYINTKDINECYKEIEGILRLFLNEYMYRFKSNSGELIFKSAYREVIKDMNREKRGNGSKILESICENIVNDNEGLLVDRKEVDRAIIWTYNSGILGLCDLYSDSISNLKPSRRVYFMDCGIASYIANKTSGIDKSNIDGMLTENFAYTELVRLYSDRRCKELLLELTPCFMVYNGYELDFVLGTKDDKYYGIEVKTTNGDAKSLKEILKKGLINHGIIARKTSGGESIIQGKKVLTIPIFAVGCRFPYGIE